MLRLKFVSDLYANILTSTIITLMKRKSWWVEVHQKEQINAHSVSHTHTHTHNTILTTQDTLMQ